LLWLFSTRTEFAQVSFVATFKAPATIRIHSLWVLRTSSTKMTSLVAYEAVRICEHIFLDGTTKWKCFIKIKKAQI
jgi:hypothetical protein